MSWLSPATKREPPLYEQPLHWLLQREESNDSNSSDEQEGTHVGVEVGLIDGRGDGAGDGFIDGRGDGMVEGDRVVGRGEGAALGSGPYEKVC